MASKSPVLATCYPIYPRLVTKTNPLIKPILMSLKYFVPNKKMALSD